MRLLRNSSCVKIANRCPQNARGCAVIEVKDAAMSYSTCSKTSREEAIKYLEVAKIVFNVCHVQRSGKAHPGGTFLHATTYLFVATHPHMPNVSAHASLRSRAHPRVPVDMPTFVHVPTSATACNLRHRLDGYLA